MTVKYAFRLLHINNIPDLLKNGIVHWNSPKAYNKYISIGDTSIIKIRNSHYIENSNYAIGDYIPFYFGPRSPMLYVIQHGYNGVTKIDAVNLVYCIIRIDDIINSNINCVFTDGHALSALTKWYSKDKLSQLDSIINYDDVYTGNWVSEDDRDLKRRKEAELLIQDDLPVQYVKGFVVYNKEAYDKMLNFGVDSNKVVIRSNFYF